MSMLQERLLAQIAGRNVFTYNDEKSAWDKKTFVRQRFFEDFQRERGDGLGYRFVQPVAKR